MVYSKGFIRFQWTILIAIYLIVIAGSFVRITGSGMGCPDWPKCFGQWVPPTQKSELPADYREKFAEKRGKKIDKFCRFLSSIGLKETAAKIQADPTLRQEEPFNVSKTWTEYGNRLVGFLAGNLLLIGLIWALIKYRQRKLIGLIVLNIVLMGIEGWFGSIVVASNLVPWTITVHMLLALIIIALQLYIVKLVSIRQKGKIEFNTTLKWLAVVILAITFYQLFLGTQVREYIDALTKQGFGRESWTEKLGWAFYIHRTFSWLVLVLMAILVWKNEKMKKYWIVRSAFIVLGIELTSGVLLAYANMPGLIQTSHLIFAAILFGILTMLVFRLNASNEAVNEQK
jgi:cytochrome c oxidase assembly protein subunit 15